MKQFILTSIAALALSHPSAAHGPGHRHPDPQPAINAALDTPAIEETDDAWGASLTTGFESRHVHYGVDETGNTGAWTTEAGVWSGDLSINVWSGFGLGTPFQEWNFTAACDLDLGPVFLLPGYNLRYTPEIEEDHHGEEEEEDHHAEHAHNTVGNEAFLILGTNKLPFVTPAVAWIWDFNNTNANSAGSFLEFRLDGDIPLYKDILSLQPYTLLGINFGYNTEDYDGWNNFQFGSEATWQITPSIALFGGLNYSIAMDALDSIGQGNVFWANVGISFTY